MLSIPPQSLRQCNPRESLTKRFKLFLLSIFAIVGFSFSPCLFAVQDSVVRQAETLIRQSDYLTAYHLLEPLESQRAGDVDYDYLFGIAGVESNNVTRGVFALERVLAIQPNHQEARVEMAKAHFLLGERDASKSEFKNALSLPTSPQTKKTIENLLNAIEKLEGKTTTFGAYAELGLGTDSNISSAPAVSTIAVPLFGGTTFRLARNGRAQSSNFMQLATGLSFRAPANEDAAFFGNVNATHRDNKATSDFDNSTLDVNAGIQYKVDEHVFSIALQDNRFYLDNNSFRRAYGATAQWIYNIDQANQAGVYAQYSKLSYPENRIRDAQRTIVGINAGHAFQHSFKPVIFGSIYGGREDARNSNADFFNQNIVGTRLGGQFNLLNQLQFFSSLGLEYRRNDANDTAFLTKRNDHQYDAALGLRYDLPYDWSLRPQFNYIKNDSNISLNSYERKMFSINVRKDFRW